jgi:hypothetical protein
MVATYNNDRLSGEQPITDDEMAGVMDVEIEDDEGFFCGFCRQWKSNKGAMPTRDAFLMCAECYRERIVPCSNRECNTLLEADVDRIEYLLDDPFCGSCYDELVGTDGDFDPVAVANAVDIQRREYV